MLGSIISYVYSIFRYAYNAIDGRPQSLQESISNLSSRDRASLLCDVTDSLHWHLSGVGDVGLGSSLEDGQDNVVIDTTDKGHDVESDLAELESVLEQCRASLEKFETKERFVGIRIQRYRGLLQRRNDRDSQLAINMSSNNDEEHNGFIESRNFVHDKQLQNEITLESVETVHKNLIAQIEVLRRRIQDLEEKKKSCIDMSNECKEFVLAAAVDAC
eukprot:scaffold43354_cov73-Cyclotella_meneghiniana.AAC.6